MCGRFRRNRPIEEVAEAFDAKPSPQLELPPSYNIPPSAPVLAVRHHPKSGERTLDALLWGLIPYFAKDRKYAYRCSNARDESVDTKPSFRSAFAKRRCIVPADGFYEWLTIGKVKHPYAFARRDQQLLAFAGLWENWKDPATGEWVRSCSLITTSANELVGRIHDRMPVILKEADYGRWLGEEPATPAELKQLLRPFAAKQMSMWPVDRRMNRPDVDDASLLEPLAHDPLSELLPGT
jgi:putative SOS response-associated peptidase YedK